MKNTGNEPITCEKTSPLRKRALVLEEQVKFIQYIIVSRDKEKIRVGRKDMVHIITEIEQVGYYLQEDNHLD